MKIRRSLVTVLAVASACCLFVTPSAQAQLKWVGGVSSFMFNDANWDFSSTAVTAVDPNVSILDDVMIGPGPFAFDPVIPELPDQQRFQLGDAQTLILDGTTLTVDGNDGVGGAPDTTDGPTVNVVGGAQFDPFFVVFDVQVNIDESSSATFGGGGNPVNGSIIDLTPGGTLGFLNEDPAAYLAEHLSKTFVLGDPAVLDVNVSVVSDGNSGSIVTAIPEPSALILCGLAVLGLLIRRR